MPEATKNSLNDESPASLYSGYTSYYSFTHNDQWLLPWGDPRREYQLRALYYNRYYTMVTGALTNLIYRVKQTPWELQGDKNLARHYTELLQNAQYGQGWDAFLSALLRDYLVQDIGAFVEVIGRGAPDTPLTTRVEGIAVLDACRVYPTGNAEFPIYYRPHRSNALVKVHQSRVIRLVDMPSSDPYYRGLGFSAMSRAASIARINALAMQYREENLDDLPPSGILAISGVSSQQFNDALKRFELARNSRGQDVFKSLLNLMSINPNSDVKVQLTPFRQVGELEVDPQKDAIMLALAIGDDPSEIYPLTSMGLSGGLQAAYQHAKGKAKILGNLLTMLTRAINIFVLPEILEFEWKSRDTEQTKAEAETAQVWAAVTQGDVQQGVISRDEARRIRVNTIPAYKDVLTDEDGNVRLMDADRLAEGQLEVEPEEPEDDEPDEIIMQDDSPDAASQKDIGTTRRAFERDMNDLLNQALNGNIERRRFGIVLRALISRHGRAAYRDGLQAGGVDPEDISEDDLAEINRLIAAQSTYVTQLGAAIFRRDAVSQAQAGVKPALWFNKSITPFYDAGLLSANRNGYYEWQLGLTEDHCSTCLSLNGQIHRLKDYHRRNLLPKSEELECGGWQCDCRLIPRENTRARGRFPS